MKITNYFSCPHGLLLGLMLALGKASISRADGPGSDSPRSPDTYAALLAGFGLPGLGGDPGELPRTERDELDRAAGQKDAAWSRLYWHTDLASAKTAARKEHKPILSLRLLGRLVDDISCANSRYFRTALYANAEISAYLREHYILHWESVGPVPKISIDFSDGRHLERTITGNSAHYILDEDGRPIDIIPGLYEPASFLRVIKSGQSLAESLWKTAPELREGVLRKYHLRESDRVQAEFSENIRVATATGLTNRFQPRANPFAAGRIAISKWGVEGSMLRAIAPGDPYFGGTSAENWEIITQLHTNQCLLDAASISLIAAKTGLTNEKLNRLVSQFQNSLAADTVRNEYVLHYKAHGWFASGEVTSLTTLNERVYAELFLTPLTDPWFGLKPEDTYAALDESCALR
jgi:hypothetical protein